MHSEDDQIAPYKVTGAKSVKLLKHGTLKSYLDLPAWHAHDTCRSDQC